MTIPVLPNWFHHIQEIQAVIDSERDQLRRQQTGQELGVRESTEGEGVCI